MPKIKNWSSTGDYSWKHDKKNIKVRVENDGMMTNGYIAAIKMNDGPWTELKGATRGNILSNKEDAKDLTVKWLKDNPNP